MVKSKQRILGLINARGGSKGVPRKNVKLLLGKPLIAYAIEAGRSSDYITQVVVSTEDSEIAEVAKKYGALVPFMRPKELSADHVKQIEATFHAIKFMEEKEGKAYDIIVLLQPTAPMRTTKDIDKSLKILMEHDDIDSVVSFTPVEQGHPYNMYSLVNDQPKRFVEVPEDLTQRQNFPKLYHRNGAIYAIRRDFVVNEGKFQSSRTFAYIMPIERSVNIDSLYDWELAEFLMKRRMKN